MNNKFSWADTSKISVKTSEAGRNFLDDALTHGAEKVYLSTQIRATHSGQLMPDRCYTGKGMKAGTGSWFDMANGGTSSFNKPIILNHDLHSKPLGRVVKATYVQVKQGKDWEEDYKRPESGPGKMGSGYIIADTAIYDKEAIEMIIDGRYDTVSSRQVANIVWCSVCGEKLADCNEHEPGQYYKTDSSEEEEFLAYAITGVLDFKELSFVNSPNQLNAKVMSFKKMSQILQDAGEDACLLVSDVLVNQEAQHIPSYLKSITDSEILIDLSNDTLPSTGSLTGRSQVSMAKIDGASDKVSIVVDVDTKKTEIADAQAPLEDLPFANLARLWKDDLDLKTAFKDTSYVLSTQDGQILEYFVGPTVRVFNSRLHNISKDMCGSTISYDILISGIDEVSKAVADLESRATSDTLDSETKQKLLTKDSTIVWDKPYFSAALKLMGRLPLEKRKQLLDEFVKSSLFVSEKTEDTEMDKSTVDSLVRGLLADKEDLKKKLTESVQLADSKETEVRKLRDEITQLKANTLSVKAGIIVDAQVAASGVTLTDDARKAKIVEFATKDESDLDKLLTEEFIVKLKPQAESKKSDVDAEDSKAKKSISDSAPIKVVSDIEPEKPSDKTAPVGKSFAALEARADEIWGRKRN